MVFAGLLSARIDGLTQPLGGLRLLPPPDWPLLNTPPVVLNDCYDEEGFCGTVPSIGLATGYYTNGLIIPSMNKVGSRGLNLSVTTVNQPDDGPVAL